MRHAIAVPLLLLAASAAGCGPAKPAASGPPRSRAYRVSVRPVEVRPLDYAVEAVGSIEAYDVVTVPARVSGTIESLGFDEGDAVTPDQVLAVVDGRRHVLEVAEAKAAVGRAGASVGSAEARVHLAEAVLREAETALDRRKGLRGKNPGWVTEDELTTLESAAERARAGLEEARAGNTVALAQVEEERTRLALAERRDQDARVRSPLAGVIERRRVSPGQYVKEGDAVATLVDVSRLRARFRVSEAESVKIRRGQVVEVRVAAFPGRAFAAEVFHVNATADPSTRMVECLASVKDPPAGFRPGFFASVRALVERKDAAIVIPVAAVIPGEKGFSAFVAVDGKARRRPLRLGLHTRDDAVEVVSGLEAGEALVVEGAGSLEDGVPLEVVPGLQAPAAGGKE